MSVGIGVCFWVSELFSGSYSENHLRFKLRNVVFINIHPHALIQWAQGREVNKDSSIHPSRPRHSNAYGGQDTYLDRTGFLGADPRGTNTLPGSLIIQQNSTYFNGIKIYILTNLEDSVAKGKNPFLQVAFAWYSRVHKKHFLTSMSKCQHKMWPFCACTYLTHEGQHYILYRRNVLIVLKLYGLSYCFDTCP